MKYDISKRTSPKMPTLGKGTECIKMLLTQVSKDMHDPLVPMLFPILKRYGAGGDGLQQLLQGLFPSRNEGHRELFGASLNIVARHRTPLHGIARMAEGDCRTFAASIRNDKICALTREFLRAS